MSEQKTETNDKLTQLLKKPDIRYKGPLSYVGLRIVAYVIVFLLFTTIVHDFSKDVLGLPEWTDAIYGAIKSIYPLTTPLLFLALCNRITSNEKEARRTVLYLFIVASGIYLATIFVYNRYILGFFKAIFNEDADDIARSFVKAIFGSVININVYIDVLLCSILYYFLVCTPKKLKSKVAMVFFRLASIIPVTIMFVSPVVYYDYLYEGLELPFELLAAIPSRSLSVHMIFVILILFVKFRKLAFIKKGGTEEQYDEYVKTNRSSLQYSVFCCLSILIVFLVNCILQIASGLFDFSAIVSELPMLFVTPVILLYSYNRKSRMKSLTYIAIAVLFAVYVITWLETFLLIL